MNTPANRTALDFARKVGYKETFPLLAREGPQYVLTAPIARPELAEAFIKNLLNVAPWRAPDFRACAQLVHVADLPSIWSLEGKITWLVENLVPESAVTLLSGESGCGKSTLALALAGAVAHGQDFLGCRSTQREVLIVDAENGIGVYKERLNRLGIDETPHLHVWGSWHDPQPSGPDHPALVEFAKELHPLIIFDSLVAFHPGSEQDSSETRRYMQRFRRLQALGATVVIIHHTGKGDNTKQYRGSSDIKASVDWAYLLASGNSDRLESLSLKSFKVREGENVAIKILFENGRFTRHGDFALSVVCGIILENPGIKQSEICRRARIKQVPAHVIREILEAGEQDGSLKVTRGEQNSKCYTIASNSPDR